MILAIDAGNTRIKWGLHDGGGWLRQGALGLDEADRLAELVQARPERAVAANVAGAAVGAALAGALQRLGTPVTWIGARREQCGVHNLYAHPEQLGADRWAALIAARALHRGACLVVNAGTATTVDVLDEAGSFQGGVILPGLDMMRRSLSQNTARLPWVEGAHVALPRNTADAIMSGCLNAQAGAIERMYAHVAAHPQPLCIVSGGAAALVCGVLTLPCRRVDNLVLDGLLRIVQDAAPGAAN